MDARLVQSVQTYTCSFILLAWYHDVWRACHILWQCELDSGKWGWSCYWTEEWRCSKCPRGQLAMFTSNSKLGVWIGMAEWSLVNVSISIKESTQNYCMTLTQLIPDQRCHWSCFELHNYCESLGVLETWFLTKQGRVFNYPQHHRGLCQQGFVHQALQFFFAQDFNSYPAYFGHACVIFRGKVVNDQWWRFLSYPFIIASIPDSMGIASLHKSGCFTAEVTPDKRKGKILLYTSEEAWPSRVFFDHSLGRNRRYWQDLMEWTGLKRLIWRGIMKIREELEVSTLMAWFVLMILIFVPMD